MLFQKLSLLEKTLNGIAAKLERAHFTEYVEYVGDRKRVLRRAFATGLLKGAGTAIGFTVLGALAVYWLEQAAKSDLPYIANFFTELIGIIERGK